MIYQISEHCGVLQGSDNRKTVLNNNPLFLEKGAYYCAGIISGISLQQGGPGLHCLADSTYDLFLGEPSSTAPELDDVADHESKLKIGKVFCSTETFNSVLGNILGCLRYFMVFK